MFVSVVQQLLPPVLLPHAKALAGYLRRPSPREIELRRAFDRLNAEAPANELVFRKDVRLIIHPASRKPMEMFCWRLPEVVDEMDVFLAYTQGRERLLDVGALHGVFSLAFAVNHPERRVVAVDPSPVAFARLLYNLHANKLNDRATAIECALSDASGRISMSYEWEHAVAAPIAAEGKVLGSVEKITGDALCDQLNFVPDVIKIDVEGHEVKVLHGLAATIHKAKPLLFIEIHPRRIRKENDNLNDILDFLSREGYQQRSNSGICKPGELRNATADVRTIFEPVPA